MLDEKIKKILDEANKDDIKMIGNKTPAIWCDIDYTLSFPGRDDLWDASNADEVDTPNEFIIEILKRFRGTCRIVFVTGRIERDKEATKRQIEKMLGFGYHLYMRKNDDYRDNHIYKKDQFENLKDKYDFLFCLDDDPEVCKTLRGLGLNVLQVVQLIPDHGNVQPK